MAVRSTPANLFVKGVYLMELVLFFSPLTLRAAETGLPGKFERGGFSKQSQSVKGGSGSSVEFGEAHKGKLLEVQIDGTPVLREVPAEAPANLCEAGVAISYIQLGEMVDIESAVQGANCGESHGEFSLRVRTRGIDGAVVDRQFTEVWHNPSTDTLAIADLYEIGVDEDLIRVSVHTSPDTACLCGPAAEANAESLNGPDLE